MKHLDINERLHNLKIKVVRDLSYEIGDNWRNIIYQMPSDFIK
jgi:hypothetical protein